jgi:ribosomal-protein-alanine N-acetyltransferase
MSEKLADETDAAALAALHAACFGEAWSAQTIADLLAQTPVFALAAPHGFILARAAGGEAEILTLAVAPLARRKGLGSALVSAAATRAHELQARTMFLEVGQANLAARALYEGLGFLPVGTRRGYYAGGEDALILKAGLPLSVLGKTR